MPVSTDGPVGGGREEANQVKNQSVCGWQHVTWNFEWGPDNVEDKGEMCFRQMMRL